MGTLHGVSMNPGLFVMLLSILNDYFQRPLAASILIGVMSLSRSESRVHKQHVDIYLVVSRIVTTV